MAPDELVEKLKGRFDVIKCQDRAAYVFTFKEERLVPYSYICKRLEGIENHIAEIIIQDKESFPLLKKEIR